MAFTWKDKADMFKGEGIYFLTFTVNNRVNLLGELRRLPQPINNIPSGNHIACVNNYDLGIAVYQEFNKLQTRFNGFQIIAKQVMPNHFHAVVWCHNEFGNQSIKMVARSFSQTCSRIALKAQGRLKGSLESRPLSRLDRLNTNSNIRPSCTLPSINAQSNCAASLSSSPSCTLPSINVQSNCATPPSPYDCGNGANTLFSPPYIRTLCHAGQLDRMVQYTNNNPDNLLRVLDNPHFYTIHRNLHLANLLFDGMGKDRLLDYPDRHVVALSRSLSPDQITAEVNKALHLAQTGTVIYTAAINTAEKAVCKAIREANYPLVVMMLDGFPPEGTDAARYFHPNGVYHTACGEGRLMLLAPLPQNYDDPHLIALTEAELTSKAHDKGLPYHSIPRDSKRWRMIACNVMLTMIASI